MSDLLLRMLMAPVRRPAATLLITLVLAILSAVAITRFRASGSASDLLGHNKPSVVALQKVLDHFPSADELLVFVSLESQPEDSEQGVATLLDFAAKVERAIAQPEALDASTGGSTVHRPVFGSVTYAASPQLLEFVKNEVVPAGVLYLNENEVAALRERLALPAMQEQLKQNEAMISAPGPAASALARTLIKDPLRLREFLGARLAGARAGFRTFQGRPEFVSEDGRNLLIRIAGTKPPSDLNFCHEITRQAERLIAPIQAASPGVQVEYSGAYAIAAASEKAIRSDLTSNIFWSVVLLQVVFLIGYRNVFSFALAFLPNLVALLVAFGLFALFNPTLTPLTAAIGATLIACGIDLSVYVISYYETARERGLTPQAAVESAIRELAMPLTAACTTTVVGFIAVAFSSIQALRDFAVLGSIGLMLSLFAAAWILPALLTRAAKVPGLAQVGARVEMGRAIAHLNRWSKPLVVACGFIAIASVAVVAVKGLPGFETDLNVMHPQPNRPLETERRIGQTFGAADTMIVYSEATTQAALLETTHKVQRALDREQVRQGAGISSVFGLPMLLPDAASTGAPTFDVPRILADFDIAVASSSFEPSAFDPHKEFLARLLSANVGPTIATLGQYPQVRDMLLARHDQYPAAITIISLADTSASTTARDRAVTAIRDAIQSIEGATLTGMGVVGHDVEHAVRADLPTFVVVSGLAVIALLLLCLRSAYYSLLSLIPLAFGCAILLAVMTLTGERLNLANAMALPLIFGIGVDYGIFLVALAQQSRRAGEDREQLLARFTASFHAITHTAITSFIGFGTLVLTTTPAVQSLGRVIGIGVVACALGAFLLLAPILLLTTRHSRAVGSPPGFVPPQANTTD